MQSTISGRPAIPRTLARATALAVATTLLVAAGSLLRPAGAAVEVVYTSDVGKQNPDVALNANGDAVAVWAENNSTLKASVRPAGGSWSVPETIGATDRGNPFPHVVIDSTGFITLVWTSTAAGTTHYMSVATRTIGGAWSAAADLDTGTYGENLAIDMDGAGTVTAAWQSPAAAIRVSSHAAGSATWTTPVAIGNGFSPVLSHGASHLGLAWQDSATAGVKAEVIDTGGTWSAGASEFASATSEVGYQPRLVFGPSDEVEGLWSRSTTDDTDPMNPVTTEAVVVASRTAPATWTAGTVVSADGDQVRVGDAAIDADGDLTLAYNEYTNAYADYALRARTRHNGTWDTATTFSTNNLSSGTVHLVVDSSGTFTAVWAANPASTSTRTGAVTWATPTALSATGTVLGASVKLDGAGHALAAWTRQFNDGSGFHSDVEASFFTPAPPADTTPPTTVLHSVPTFSYGSTVPLSWTATDTQSAVTGTDVRKRSAAWNKPYSAFSTLLSNSHASTVTAATVAGATTCFSARSRDESANVEAFGTERCTTVPADDRIAARSAGWVRRTSSAYYRGSVLATTRKGATLTISGIHERSIALMVSRGPSNGRIAIYWRGVRIGTYSLASPKTHHRQLLTVRTNALPQTGTLVIKVVGKKHLVRIDGFAIRQ